MNPNCKIGKVTPKGNLVLLPRPAPIDIEDALREIAAFVKENGCVAFGAYVCGNSLTATRYAGQLKDGVAASAALHRHVMRDWWE
jgi:hypothetical protein